MALVALERVVFRESIDCPGPTAKDGLPPIYPERAKVLGCYAKPSSMMAKQAYNLFLDEETGAVVVEFPVSKEREWIPRENIVQFRPLKPETIAARSAAEKAAAAPKAAKPGLASA